MLQGQQVEEQLQALQQEHHRLSESHMGVEKNNGLLQEECNQLQVCRASKVLPLYQTVSVCCSLSSWQLFVQAGQYDLSTRVLFADLLCVVQGYISVLDEDLGKAQERIGSVLAVDDHSTARQNEMLKAAANQVTDFASLTTHTPSAVPLKPLTGGSEPFLGGC